MFKENKKKTENKFQKIWKNIGQRSLREIWRK